MLDRIGEHGVKSRVIFQSFDFAILHRMNRLAPGITLAALWEGEARSFVEIAQEAGTGDRRAGLRAGYAGTSSGGA